MTANRTLSPLIRLGSVLCALALWLSSAAAQDSRTLVMGWTEDPPFHTATGAGQDPTGFAPDLVRAIADRVGLDVTFRAFPTTEALIAAQRTGASQMVVAARTLPNQFGTSAASTTVVTTRYRLFVAAERAGSIDPNDLSGLRIGIGSRAQAGADLSRLIMAERIALPDEKAMILALLSGEVDALVAAESVVAFQVIAPRLDSRIIAIGPVLGTEPRPIFLHESRAGLMADIDAALVALTADGSLPALRRKWHIEGELQNGVPAVLRVGVSHYPPYTTVNEDGSFGGLSTDSLRELARRAGLDLEFMAITADDWIAGPSADTYDLLPQAGINADRRARMDFTLPLERAELSLFVRRDQAGGIATLDDVAGRRVGVRQGHLAQNFALAQPGFELVTASDTEGLFEMLDSGAIDAALFTKSAGLKQVQAQALDQSIVVIDPPVSVSERATALRPGLAVIREKLNAVIPGYLVSGDYLALRQSYLEPTPFWSPERLRSLAIAAAIGLGLLVAAVSMAFVMQSNRARRQAERLTAETQALSSSLGAVLDATQSGILGLDRRGRVVIANPRARHMLDGLSTPVPFDWPSDICFVKSEDMKPMDATEHPINRALAGHSLKGEKTVMTRRNGSDPRYVRVSSARVAEDVSPDVGTVIVLDDVSEQEKNRQQAERSSRLDALGQLTGGIAHDFNNLLATIEYGVQLAIGESDADRRESYLSTALGSVRRGGDLTQRLLTFARRQPGLAKSRLVQEILMDFARLAQPTIEEAIDLEFACDQQDLFVFCDVSQLENALLNLVLNSRDAILRSGKGNRIVVRARAVAELDADAILRREDPHSYIAKGQHKDHAAARAKNDGFAYRYVEFAVTDNGPGMTDEVKRRAIDPFFGTKDSASGTGLGLSMVYGFIQQSNGEMRIYSELGQGSTVRMILPRGTVAGEREAPVERLPAPTGKGQKVLVVEDEDNLLAMMIDVVTSLGYAVTPARSGKAALDLIRSIRDFDLILTDVVMPGGIGGFELARQARQTCPGLPVVYMSGYTGFSAEEMGDVVAPLVQKPSTPRELAQVIESTLKEAPARMVH